ncbi:MAG: hydrogenase maturation nickel metallochaperone HypA [Actinobacteria bacterium]|nr:hydrogenase maturation nickel metallochaperone HypA [Actinomycetota bacterium]
MVEGEANRTRASRVDEITVVMGELSTFVADSIEFYFSELARGTIAEGAVFRFQKLEARAVCSNCGFQFRPQNAIFTCPDCSSPFFELKQGRELFIESIDVSGAQFPRSEGVELQ